MNIIRNRIAGSKTLSSFLSSLIAVMVGLIFGLIILLISNPGDALLGFKTILAGGFTGGSKGLGQIFYYAAPIIMTGLSVAFAFKTGLFNIGASGQFIVGGLAAVYVGVKLTWLPGSLHWMVAVLAAGIAGGLWALLPGVFKAYLNVNEVLSTIMMNYIGMYMVNMIVVNKLYDSLKNQSLPVAKTATLPKMGLDKIFVGSNISVGIVIAIISAIIIYIILNKTVLGYELKACGFNMDASKYAGIDSKRKIVLAMVIAGILSGLGGAIVYLSQSGKHLVVQDVIAPEGFSGISVALLGLSNPIGVILSGVFIGYITVGGFYMQMFDIPPQIVDIIIATIIYFSAFGIIFRELLAKSVKKSKAKEGIE